MREKGGWRWQGEATGPWSVLLAGAAKSAILLTTAWFLEDSSQISGTSLVSGPHFKTGAGGEEAALC